MWKTSSYTVQPVLLAQFWLFQYILIRSNLLLDMDESEAGLLRDGYDGVEG
jgi:hypothetical protein